MATERRRTFGRVPEPCAKEQDAGNRVPENGVKLQDIITWFDNFSVLLRRDGHTQLVYKHAISTVMPGAPIQLFDGTKVEGAAAAPARELSPAAGE